MDQIDLPPHQFGKGVFGTGSGITARQLEVWCHLQLIAPVGAEIAQENEARITQIYTHYKNIETGFVIIREIRV
jgi:hypothetical protein